MHILPVTPEDKNEILALFALDKKIWPSGVGQNWYWFWREKTTKEEWVKVLSVLDGEPRTISPMIVASAHWSIRRDGWRNLKDIIVHPLMRGHGIGRVLMDHIGRPVMLKTDHDSDANGFYQKLGLQPGELVWTKSMSKQLRLYASPMENNSQQ